MTHKIKIDATGWIFQMKAMPDYGPLVATNVSFFGQVILSSRWSTKNFEASSEPHPKDTSDKISIT